MPIDNGSLATSAAQLYRGFPPGWGKYDPSRLLHVVTPVEDGGEEWPGHYEVMIVGNQYKLALFKQPVSRSADTWYETLAVSAVQAGVADLEDLTDLYFLSQVEQVFSSEEVDVLRAYLGSPDDAALVTRPARKPRKGYIGVSLTDSDFTGPHHLGDEIDCGVPFRVWWVESV